MLAEKVWARTRFAQGPHKVKVVFVSQGPFCSNDFQHPFESFRLEEIFPKNRCYHNFFGRVFKGPVGRNALVSEIGTCIL